MAWAQTIVFETVKSLGTNQHGQLLNALVAMTKRYVLLHPEYNSHRGFEQLSDPEFDPEFTELARFECNAFLDSIQN